MSKFESIKNVWDFLDDIPMFQKAGVSAANFSLDNIQAFCKKLGDPHLKFPVIHIAGTNGKGTTAYFLEELYQNGRYKTGLFTSPHLLRYNERVRVNQKEISDDDLLRFFQQAESFFEEFKLSYFEISTALAFWFFDDQKVDIAIVEAGIGGRLDSTNIVNPDIAVIASIGLDHQNVLGNSIQEIAREKAGIIKQNKPVVIGNVDESALQEITIKANARNSEILLASDLNPQWESGDILLERKKLRYRSHFRESINKWNVACARLVWQKLQSQFPCSNEIFQESVEDFIGAPGRFEKLHSQFQWFFSGSHNLQALESSILAIKEMADADNVTIIFSAMKDKVNPELIGLYKPFKKLYFVEQEGERAAKASDIAAVLDVQILDEMNAKKILNELKTELVIFTGSFYFYPYVKRWISKL